MNELSYLEMSQMIVSLQYNTGTTTTVKYTASKRKHPRGLPISILFLQAIGLQR